MKKKDVFVSSIKGFITGISLWINNMSFASMTLSLNSYDNVLEAFNSIRKKNNKDLWYFTIPLFFCILIGLIAGHRLISIVWNKYQLQTIILFCGLFIGGIRVICFKQKLVFNRKNAFIPLCIVSVSIFLFYTFKSNTIVINNPFLDTFVLGVITAISVFIPSFSALSNNISGGYNSLINTFNSITSINNILIIIVFAVTCILFLLIVSRVIKLLFKFNKNNTYIALCSCILVNAILLIVQIKPFSINFVNIFTSMLAFLWGYLLGVNVEKE